MRPLTLNTGYSDDPVQTIECWPTTTPGLVVWEHAGLNCGQATRWALLLARHGSSIGYCWDSPEGALRAAQLLEPFGNWQQTWDEIRQSMRGFGPRLVAAIEPTGPCRHRQRDWRSRSVPLVDNGVVA